MAKWMIENGSGWGRAADAGGSSRYAYSDDGLLVEHGAEGADLNCGSAAEWRAKGRTPTSETQPISAPAE